MCITQSFFSITPSGTSYKLKTESEDGEEERDIITQEEQDPSPVGNLWNLQTVPAIEDVTNTSRPELSLGERPFNASLV